MDEGGDNHWALVGGSEGMMREGRQDNLVVVGSMERGDTLWVDVEDSHKVGEDKAAVVEQERERARQVQVQALGE